MRPQVLRVSSIGELADARPAFSAAAVWPPVVVGLAYYLGCLAGFALRYPGSGISFFWPPNAILTASLLLMPARWWPRVGHRFRTCVDHPYRLERDRHADDRAVGGAVVAVRA